MVSSIHRWCCTFPWWQYGLRVRTVRTNKEPSWPSIKHWCRLNGRIGERENRSDRKCGPPDRDSVPVRTATWVPGTASAGTALYSTKPTGTATVTSCFAITRKQHREEKIRWPQCYLSIYRNEEDDVFSITCSAMPGSITVSSKWQAVFSDCNATALLHSGRSAGRDLVASPLWSSR
jgi:hypothetical protein